MIFYLETIGSSLDHDLTVSICEKAISILAGNLNSGRSYLITAVLGHMRDKETKHAIRSRAKKSQHILYARAILHSKFSLLCPSG